MSTAEPVRTGSGTIAEVYDLGHALRLTNLHIGFTRATGSGTDTAPITVVRQGRHQDDTLTLFSHPAAGVGKDVHMRLEADQSLMYQIGAVDKVKIDWATPDGDDLVWAIHFEWEHVRG